jgi:glutamate-1-semialdehyde 2,1-aminomutase
MLQTATAKPDQTIENALSEAHARFVAHNPQSRRCHQRACEVMPGGNTRSILFHLPFPLTMTGGEGCHIQDADGHRYIDLLGEFTAGLFGHSHDGIRASIEHALAGGINLSGHSRLEAELARSICERFHSIARVRFTNSGTEANLMAVATARHFTGRARVLAFRGGYHGGVLNFGERTSPVNAPYEFTLLEFNDLEGARHTLEHEGEQFAAILVEPMLGAGGCIPAGREFLQCLREQANRHGALLIFDEVMASRLAPGGMQDVHGVAADLTTLGKYLGGGMSFGAFGGRADILDLYDPRRPDAIQHAGTFNNNVVTMSAGLAALAIYTPALCRELNARGDALRTQLNGMARSRGLAIEFTGIGSLMTVHFSTCPVTRPSHAWAADAALKELFYFDMLERGLYMARRGMTALSLEIGDAECTAFAAAVADFMDVRQGLIQRRSERGGDVLF